MLELLESPLALVVLDSFLGPKHESKGAIVWALGPSLVIRYMTPSPLT